MSAQMVPLSGPFGLRVNSFRPPFLFLFMHAEKPVVVFAGALLSSSYSVQLISYSDILSRLYRFLVHSGCG